MSLKMVRFLSRWSVAGRLPRTWSLALAALLALLGARSAEACSCFENPPCAAVWKADAVFIGTVVDRAPERIGGSLSWTVHKVAVGQTLRGSVDSLITLVSESRPTAKEIAASQSHSGEVETM